MSNSVEEGRYWNKMWNSFLNKTVHVVVSRRIVFDERAKKGRNRNTKSFHFPNVDEFNETSSSIKKATRDNDELSDETYHLDIFIDEVFEVKPDRSKARGTGLLSRKMANQTKRYVKRHILERWVIQKSNKRTGMSHTLNKLIYQKATILMRSLYSYLLLLPCYKIFRRNQRNRRSLSKLKYKFYRVTGVSKHENEVDSVGMELHQKYKFSPVVTSVCQMNLFVEYTKDFRLNPQEQPLIDSGLIRKDTLSEFEESSGEIEEEVGPVSSFDPANENEATSPDVRIGYSPSRPVPTKNQKNLRRRSNSNRSNRATSIPSSRRRSGSYRGGTSYEEEIVGSPPFARFVGSIEKHPHHLYGTSFEKNTPFGVLKPSVETGTSIKLPFSPFNSPVMHSYSSSTASDHYSTTPTPPKYTNTEIQDHHQKNRNEGLKVPEHIVNQFTPPDPSPETFHGLIDFKGTTTTKTTDDERRKNDEEVKLMRPVLPPMLMDYKVDRNSRLNRSTTPDTPKEFTVDEGIALAFIDDEAHEGENDEDKSSLYHELVGDLLNKIENAPILAAFYDENGDVKKERLQDVLNTLTKLERGKKMMMMMK